MNDAKDDRKGSEEPTTPASSETRGERSSVDDAPKARPRRWRRRIAISLVVVAVVAVLLRIALWLTLASLVDNAARAYNLTCTYERLDLSLLTGDAELWHLVLAPTDGGEPFVDAEYTRADIAVSALFTGRLVIRRLEVDGVDVALTRDADGKIDLLERVMAGEPFTRARVSP